MANYWHRTRPNRNPRRSSAMCGSDCTNQIDDCCWHRSSFYSTRRVKTDQRLRLGCLLFEPPKLKRQTNKQQQRGKECIAIELRAPREKQSDGEQCQRGQAPPQNPGA